MRGKESAFFIFVQCVRITPAHAGKRYASGFISFFVWDHPRTCGEKFLITLLLMKMVGSPPHMRGKGPLNVISLGTIRITPAHAGKSRLALDIYGGSPPHMRGKASIFFLLFKADRITPAHAGKRFSSESFS